MQHQEAPVERVQHPQHIASRDQFGGGAADRALLGGQVLRQVPGRDRALRPQQRHDPPVRGLQPEAGEHLLGQDAADRAHRKGQVVGQVAVIVVGAPLARLGCGSHIVVRLGHAEPAASRRR